MRKGFIVSVVGISWLVVVIVIVVVVVKSGLRRPKRKTFWRFLL